MKRNYPPYPARARIRRSSSRFPRLARVSPRGPVLVHTSKAISRDGDDKSHTAPNDNFAKSYTDHKSNQIIRRRLLVAFDKLIERQGDTEDRVRTIKVKERFESCRARVRFNSNTNEVSAEVRSCELGRICPYCSKKIQNERAETLRKVLQTSMLVEHTKHYYSFATLTLSPKITGLDKKDGRGKLEFIRRELRRWKNRNNSVIKGSVSKIEWTINDKQEPHIHAHLIIATDTKTELINLMNDWRWGFTNYKKLNADLDGITKEFGSGVFTYLNKAIDTGASVEDLSTHIDIAYHKQVRLYSFTGVFRTIKRNVEILKKKNREKEDIKDPPKPPAEHDLEDGEYSLLELSESAYFLNSATAKWLLRWFNWNEKFGKRYREKIESIKCND